MAVYMGFGRRDPDYAAQVAAKHREEGWSEDLVARDRVATLLDALPPTVAFEGTFVPMGSTWADGDDPAVMIAETDNPADLLAINRHYAGYVNFRWVPAFALRGTSEERVAGSAQG